MEVARKSTIQYDALNRPVATLLYNNSTTALKVETITYGTSAAGYTIGKPVTVRDQGGKLDITSYDFKGNLLSSTRRLCNDYDLIIDWFTYTDPTGESFNTEFSFDAMNRPVTETTPDGKVRTYEYNKAGLLERVLLDEVEYVSNIDYNEKGQRTDIYFGNTSKTRYYYDSQNFRLTRLLTTRNNGSVILQDLNYTYDPEGNIVQQDDNAQQTNYFNNTVIAPVGKYEYDALYRIVKAEGRELTVLGMATDTDFVNSIPVPNNGSNAMQNYTQLYSYDQLGNMLTVQSQNKWTRSYYYDNATNRLLRHDTGSDVYSYDAQGNMLSMPHLQLMGWDFKGNLAETKRTGNGYSTYYRYDSVGNRIRKVTLNGNIREERIYIGNYEVYRKTVNGTLDSERESSFVSDDTKRIAIVDTRNLPTPVEVTIRYQYDNHLGSTCLELDSSAQVISYEEFHPFGTTSYRAGRNATETSLKRYKYVGKERDEETGLYYYGARYYAAWLCRFVSVDPLQFKYPHYTPFQYAGNKPISFIDLDGLEPWPVKAEIGEYTRVITSGMYRNQGGKMHGAVDIAFKIDRKGKNVKVDAEVVATHSGIIEIHKNRGKAGNYITITNGDIRTRYLHLQKDDQGGTFKNGDFVNQGEKIGLLGMSGTDNPHLHYEIQVKKDGNWGKINPVIGDPDKVSAKDKFELKDPQKMIYGDSIKNDTDFGIDYFIENTTIGPKETKLSDRLLETHIPVIKSFGDLLKLIKL